MKKIRQYTLILSLVTVVYTTKSQEASQGAFTLQQAIEYALKNSPVYVNAELDEKSADHRRKEVTGMGLPQIDGSVDAKNYFHIPQSVIPVSAFNPLAPPDTYTNVQFGVRFNTTAGLSASQLIFSADYVFGLKASKAFMNLARIQVNSTRSDIIANLSKAYYTVLISRDRINLLDANIARLKKILDETKAFNQQGFAELIDVERLEVQYNNLLTESANAHKLVGISELALKFNMGYKLNDPITLSDSLRIDNSTFQELPTTNLNINQRGDFLSLRGQQELLDLDVKRLKWGYLPTVVAYASYQYNRMGDKWDILENDPNNPVKRWYKIGLVGATVNLKIFDGMQRHHKIQQAKITALKNENLLKNLTLGAEMEAASAAITYNNAYSSLMNQKRNLELARHVYDVAQKKFKEGVGSNLEVFTAETSLKESQTNYFVAVFDMMVAKIDYEKATGAYMSK